MAKVTIFDLSTCLITQVIDCTGSLEGLAPPGCGLVVGAFDQLSQRIQFITDDFGDQVPVVVDYQPAAPADDDWQTWGWNAFTKRWVAAPTMPARRATASAPALAELARLDGKLIRPLSEVIGALVAGQAIPADPAQRVQTINASKAALLAWLNAIAAAETPEALATIVAGGAGLIESTTQD